MAPGTGASLWAAPWLVASLCSTLLLFGVALLQPLGTVLSVLVIMGLEGLTLVLLGVGLMRVPHAERRAWAPRLMGAAVASLVLLLLDALSPLARGSLLGDAGRRLQIGMSLFILLTPILFVAALRFWSAPRPGEPPERRTHWGVVVLAPFLTLLVIWGAMLFLVGYLFTHG